MGKIEDLIRDEGKRAVVRAVVDADLRLDATLFAGLFTQDGVFKMGGNPPLTGRASIEAGVGVFFAMLGGGIEHEFGQAWETEDTLVYQARCRMTLGDARRLTLPYVNVLRFEGERVRDYHVHIDLSPLMAGAPPREAASSPAEDTLCTVLTVFEVAPQHQQALLDDLRRYVAGMEPYEGLVSSRMLASLDGERVVNHLEWRSVEDFERAKAQQMTRVKETPAFFRELVRDRRPYRVAFRAKP